MSVTEAPDQPTVEPSRPGRDRGWPRRGLRGRPGRRRTAPPGPRRTQDPTAAAISSAFGMLALVCLWPAVQLLLLGSLSQDRAQELLYDDFRTAVASGTAPLGPVTPVGTPVALVTAPSIDLEQVVVEGSASGDTLVGPGHLRSTVLPGQEGTSVVLGRATTYGSPFADLTDLRVGDPIDVVVAQGTTRFTVLGVRRTGDPYPQPRPEGAARLTLVTAEGAGRLAALRPSQAVYVDAEAAEALPAPPGLPTAVPEAEEVMAGDPAALPLLALCLALLLALTLAVVAARQRWSTAVVWVLACPLALALSWAATDVVMRLLPNVM